MKNDTFASTKFLLAALGLAFVKAGQVLVEESNKLDAMDAGAPRPATVTSHLWVKKGAEEPPRPKGCGCDVSGGVSLGLVVLIQVLNTRSKRSKTNAMPS